MTRITAAARTAALGTWRANPHSNQLQCNESQLIEPRTVINQSACPASIIGFGITLLFGRRRTR